MAANMAAANHIGYSPRHSVAAKGPIFRRTPVARPLSNATEIFDTDFESDESDKEESPYDSPRWSAASLADSMTTISTARDVRTPDSVTLPAFPLHVDDRPVLGPKGPHLFRASTASDELKSTYEADFVLAKTPTMPSFGSVPWNFESKPSPPLPEQDTFAEPPQTRTKSINVAVSALDKTEVKSWSPSQVVQWMREAGFDESVVEKFLVNDISGAILLDLQPEDLKELDIRSFGKRRTLMNSIQSLRDSILVPQVPSAGARSSQSQPSLDRHPSNDSTSTTPREENKSDLRQQYHYCPPNMKEVGATHDFVPNNVASIVAIEQILPAPHRCSKGRNCRKWQRQQSKIARLAKDLPIDMTTTNQIYDPRQSQYEHQPPLVANGLPSVERTETPSTATSSSPDVFESKQTPDFSLSDLGLSELNIHDPQENVRQYLYSEVEPSNNTKEHPLTAMPHCPIERDVSQSVPPNMKFGRNVRSMTTPIPTTRPASTANEHYRQRFSSIGSSIQKLDPVEEVVQPIDTLEDLNATQSRPSDAVIHSGWMKKRKRTRMLKHEWEPHHFTLKGTRLAMFEDEEASRRESKALEHIDVDDYAVACSSLASRSKLTSAFKETVFKRKNATQDDTAFAFSLLPASKGGSTAFDKKNPFVNNGKSHHFAVNTCDERIDWMRELMLAKALKREKDNGNSIHVNGNVF